MYAATTALSSPVTRKTSGMLRPAPSSRPAPSELTMMNNAFRMLLAAMMRARCEAGLRSWISAYIGTLNRPTNSDSRPRSAMTRQCAGCAKNCDSVISGPSGNARDAKYRSTANTLMPMAPSGTRPISTWRRLSTSHSSAPMPTPTENTTSSIEATRSSPCSTSFANDGNCARNTAPKNHIQLMPSSERKTTRLPCASRRLRQVSVNGFQLMRRPGSVAGDSGTACASTRPATATARHAPETQAAPVSGSAISSPPATWPSRMATKVPISIMPLPPVISRSFRCCGR